MRRATRASLGLAVVLALVIGPALFAFLERAEASDGAVTTVLQPGLNLAGWTGDAAGVEAIFETIPALEAVYAWDSESQRFRGAIPTDSGVLGDLDTLMPGMGLVLLLGGGDSFTWTRPLVPESAKALLSEGWNLVAWADDSRTVASGAFRGIGDVLVTALDANGRRPRSLQKGDAVWLRLSGDREWDQLYRHPVVEFVTDFPQDREDEIEEHVDEVVEFFSRRLGVRASGVTIRYGDPTIVPCGEYRSATHIIVIRDDSCSRAFVHEYVHALQGELAGNVDLVPLWLVEGSAEYWADVYREAFESEGYADEFWLQTRMVERRAFIPTGLSYDFAHLAAHALVKMVGEDTMLSYFRALRTSSGSVWQEAFQEATGMEHDEFYLAYAERFVELGHSLGCPAAWYMPGDQLAEPPHEVCRTLSGRLTDGNGRPRSGVLVEATDGNLGGEGAIASSVTGPDGRFSMTLPIGTYFVGLRAHFLPIGYFAGGRSYYGGVTGFTNANYEAASISLESGDVDNITMSSRLISGVVRGKDQELLRDIAVLVFRPTPGSTWPLGDTRVAYRRVVSFPPPTDESGRFAQLVQPGTYKVALVCGQDSVTGTFAGWFGGEAGLVSAVEDAVEIAVDAADATGIAINLPFTQREVNEQSCSPARFEGDLGGHESPTALDTEDYEPPRIEFATEVTPEHQAEVRALIDDVVDFFYERLGVRASGLTVRYGHLSIAPCGVYQPETHTITIPHPACFHVIPHEYVHALQGQLRGRTFLGAPWIVEGSADYWAAVYYDATGEVDYVEGNRSRVQHAEDTGFIPIALDYQFAHLAVHYLVKAYGEDSLASYFRGPLVPSRDGWSHSFEEAFGIGLSQFYIDFARFLRSRDDAVGCPVSWHAPGSSQPGAPPETCRRIQGVVTDLEGNPRSGAYVEAAPDSPGRHLVDGLAFDKTEGDGRFSLVLPAATYRVVACLPGSSEAPCNGTTTAVAGYRNGTGVDLRNRDSRDVVLRAGLVSGRILGSSGEAIRGIPLLLATPVPGIDFSANGEAVTGHATVSLTRLRTGGDGQFQWLVPEGTYRILVLCPQGGFAGWYGGSGGLVGTQSEATAIVADTEDVTDIVINLPATQAQVQAGNCVAATE